MVYIVTMGMRLQYARLPRNVLHIYVYTYTALVIKCIAYPLCIYVVLTLHVGTTCMSTVWFNSTDMNTQCCYFGIVDYFVYYTLHGKV